MGTPNQPIVSDTDLPNEPEVVVDPPVVTDPPAPTPNEEEIEKVNGLYQLKVGHKIYKAKTIRLLMAEVAKAMQNADQRIKELNTLVKFGNGLETPDRADDLESTPVQPIAADEAFQLAIDLNKPETMTKAIKRVVEAELGAPLESLKGKSDADKAAEFKRRAFAAGKEFMLAHPEFIPSAKNEQKMFTWMEAQNIQPISARNYEIAYNNIKDTLDLREPVTEEPVVTSPAPPEPVIPQNEPVAATPPVPANPPRARQASTGVRSSNSALPATPNPTAQGIPGMPTREQIDRATAQEFAQWYRNPKFQEHYNLLYPPKKA